MQVLIDVSYLAYRALHSMDGLEFDDIPTGVIYGFFEQLLTISSMSNINSNHIHLFFDSRQSYRKRAYPQYKVNRAKDRTPEELTQILVLHEQLDRLRRKILPEIGFSIYRQTGLESDDLIAQSALQLKDERAVIITADGDLYQCITENIHWYDPARTLYLSPESFFKKKGISSDKWGKVKCFCGCPGDNVKGIPSVGEKTAIEYLNNTLPTHYKRYKVIESDAGAEIIWNIHDLVVLPHPKTKKVNLTRPVYNPQAFFEWCERLGISSYLKGKRHKQWSNFFDNIFDETWAKVRRRGTKHGARTR
jgi:5'-3' exonuclease